VDDVRLGNTLRMIRIRKRLRQVDVARRAGVRRELIGRIERFGPHDVRLQTFRAVAAALGVRVETKLRWQGGDLDRIVNEAHAALHEALAHHLSRLPGWTWKAEVSFSIYGERGVIDILAWHAEARSLLIIELKTELVDPQDLVGTMDRRVRLGARIAAQLGWVPRTVSAWVVLTDTRTNHRRVLRHAGLVKRAFPADGHGVRSWLIRPAGRISALSYWTGVRPGATRLAPGQPQRVRSRPTAPPRVARERGEGPSEWLGPSSAG
jgi:transcriptional regulator with XRE-family HTH domain